MKKIILLILAFAFIHFIVFSSNSVSKKPNLKNLLLNVKGEFPPSRIETFNYNVSIFDQYKSVRAETDSVPNSRTDIEYNENNITGIIKTWESNEWKNEFKYISYLRNETNVDSTYSYLYDSINFTWQPLTKFVTEYTGELKSRDVTYMADSITGEMKLLMEIKYTYNESSLLIGELISFYEEESGEWVPLTNTEYHLSNNGKIDSTINYMKFPGLDEWMLTSKTEHFYDNNGNPDYELGYSWGTFLPGWNESSFIDFMVNTSGNIYFEEEFSWDLISTNWTPNSTYTTIFSNGTKPLIDEYRLWIDQLNEYVVEEKSFYYYEPVNGVFTNFLQKSVSIYPNPSTDFVNVKIQQPKNAFIQFYDLTGKLVLQKKLNNETSIIPVNQLKKGNYLVKINNQNQTHSEIIVIK